MLGWARIPSQHPYRANQYAHSQAAQEVLSQPPFNSEDVNISTFEHNFPVNPSLEALLANYVTECLNEGVIPQDEQLRNKARALLGVSPTPLDDPILLAIFKDFYRLRYGFSLPNETILDWLLSSFGRS
jgi:hypothetical protein